MGRLGSVEIKRWRRAGSDEFYSVDCGGVWVF